jgi:hypothetical protein
MQRLAQAGGMIEVRESALTEKAKSLGIAARSKVLPT